MLDKDQDRVLVQELTANLNEWKKKYEHVKTELRNTKGRVP